MTRPIVFVDTETTALGHLARPWEIALIHRYPAAESGGRPADTEHVLHVTDELPAGTSPRALDLNGYQLRCGLSADVEDYVAGAEWRIAHIAHEHLVDAVLVGVGVHFDAAVLSAMFRRHGLPEEPWHYAIVDLKAATWGALVEGHVGGIHTEASTEAEQLPMSSDRLAAALGVTPATGAERHTALGDARWAARWFDALTGGEA